LFSIKKIVKQS